MVNASLILEGGALRSLFTAGVLDVFMKNNLYFKEVIGVSAGALTGANYISKQPGRSAFINLEHTREADYYGLYSFIKNKSIFNFDFIFDKPINEIFPFDEKTFSDSKQKFISVATNCITGEPTYLNEKSYKSLILALRASSSMPFLAPKVMIGNSLFLDGGISDPVPIKKAQENSSKIVVVLTREKGYRKHKTSYIFSKLAHIIYKDYPILIDKLLNINNIYNSSLDYVEQLEKENKVFIIYPKNKVCISKIEKDRNKLLSLYEEGVNQTESLLENLMNYLR